MFRFLNFKWNELWYGIGFLTLILSFQIIKFTPKEKMEITNEVRSKDHSKLGFSLVTISYGLYGFGYVSFGTLFQPCQE